MAICLCFAFHAWKLSDVHATLVPELILQILHEQCLTAAYAGSRACMLPKWVGTFHAVPEMCINMDVRIACFAQARDSKSHAHGQP